MSKPPPLLITPLSLASSCSLAYLSCRVQSPAATFSASYHCRFSRSKPYWLRQPLPLKGRLHANLFRGKVWTFF